MFMFQLFPNLVVVVVKIEQQHQNQKKNQMLVAAVCLLFVFCLLTINNQFVYINHYRESERETKFGKKIRERKWLGFILGL